MHIHGTPFTVEAADFYSAQMQRQAAARRAQQTRKRLQRAASAPAADASPEEALLIGQWLGSTAEVIRSAPMLAGDEYHPSHSDGEA
ncbi:MAG: hypothetical protein P4L03_00135 [Terracidiphilus sp.]|nr:hypothetical protein [Terracidiphilus sp.]